MNKILIALLFLLPTLTYSKEEDSLYFANLVNDQPIRANNGNFIVKVNAVDCYVLKMDDVVVDSACGDNTHHFYNVDRGTHKLTLQDRRETKSIEVHILRVGAFSP